MSRDEEKTSRLYEGESIGMYNPKNGVTQDYQPSGDPFEQDENAVVFEKARQAEELLNSAGWKLLKEDIDKGIKDCIANLRETDPQDYGQIARLQAGAKIYENIEGFINRYILEGRLAMDNRPDPQDED